ncbi:MAG TPA: HAMP domain-containing sensor histidine kinase [Stellaceae bacterium]|nr:HAMP domain-containing sensor histidine kinase [Stellaceae bacterium]
MIFAPREKRGSLLDGYCLQLGILVERRHTELALVAAKEQAETAARLATEAMFQAQEASRAKTKFLSNMTHELRTPLNAIIGFSDIIKNSQDQAQGGQAEYGKYIHDAGVHLLGIVNGVLELGRIQAGTLKLDEETVPLDEVLRAAVRTVRPSADEKQVEIVYPAKVEELVFVDAGRMKQVFVNLLSNAVKFTDPGGRATIEISHEGTHLVISVADTGIGIPADHLEKVLEPFGQVEDHLTRQSEGAGLGLPIANALVGLHGGEIVLLSAPGTGTTAQVRLPRSRIRVYEPAPRPR